MNQLKFLALSTMIFVLVTSLLLLPFLKPRSPELYVTFLTALVAIAFTAYLILSSRKNSLKEAP